MKGNLGMPYIEFHIKKGIGKQIAKFYRDYFSAIVDEEDGGEGLHIARVSVGAWQVLYFFIV